jgi:hypothetical protein
MLQATALVALGGLSLGTVLARLLAESFPSRFAVLFTWPGIILLAIVVAGSVLAGWKRLGHRFALRTDKSPSDILNQDALAHLPLLLTLLYVAHSDVDLTRGWTLVGGAMALMIALRTCQAAELGVLPNIWAERALVSALFAIPFLFYLRTLTPGVGTKDGFELQVVSATLGIAHPTGYPLFTLMGHLFIALVPVGSPAYRINLMCAFFAALSVPLVYAIALRVLKHRAPAALTALIFAFTPTFWTQASIPEKYTLNVWFVAVVIYLAVRWAQEADDRKARWLCGLAFAYGLSLTHHRTMLLLAPGLVLYLLLTERALLRRPRRLLAALGLFAAPLLLYLYLPWRAYAQGWHMTWTEFLGQISGSEYAPALRLGEWLTSPERRATYLRFLRNQFGILGIGLGAIGWLALLRQTWRDALLTSVIWVVYVIFSIGYHAYYNDVNYFLPSHLVFALWIGAGQKTLARGTAALVKRLGSTTRLLPVWRAGYWTLVALLPLSFIWTHLPEVDQSQSSNDLPWAEYALSLDLPPEATILADSVKVAPLYYLTTVEKVRPDVKVVVLPDEIAYVKSLEAHLVQGLPVYLARYLPNLGGTYHLRSLGPLVEVSLSPLTEPPPVAYPMEATFEGAIRLLGYDAPRLAAARQDALHVTLYWQPSEPVADSYHPRLRLTGPTGHVWWEEAGHLPVSEHYPTNAWRPGEVIPDHHEIPIAATLQPGDYCLEVGLFRPFAERGLPVGSGEADLVTLGTVTVKPGWEGKPLQPTLHRRDLIAPNLMLTGIDVPEQARPGSQAKLWLHWQVLGSLPNYYPILGLRGEGSPGLLTQSPWPKEYITSAWHTGQVMVTQHLVEVPTGLNGREGAIQVQLDDTAPILKVAHLRIEGVPVTGQETAVNFDDQMLLMGYDIHRKELRPGELFEMAINWRGLANMDEDYTIFIHLLGPDGLSHGQVDVWPHDGTYPTSTWATGEVIADTYRLPLEADAPPGAYRVEVGVYLLRTMGRLPVIDASGRPTDDKLLIEGLTVQE